MIKGLLDYLTGCAPLKRALLDKEKEIETYQKVSLTEMESRNFLTLENKFLKEEKDVLMTEKNKQYQTIQELLDNEKLLKEQIEHLVEKVKRLEIRLEAEKQRADGLLKEVESWKAAALKNDEQKKKALKEADQNKKRKGPAKKFTQGMLLAELSFINWMSPKTLRSVCQGAYGMKNSTFWRLLKALTDSGLVIRKLKDPMKGFFRKNY
jgi:hypothetical protein